VVKKLQIISPNSGIDKEAVVKLRKEIEVYKKMNHENIVKFYGSEMVGPQFCIYLEYMPGGTI
jgi:serine/threonine protein kinase